MTPALPVGLAMHFPPLGMKKTATVSTASYSDGLIKFLSPQHACRKKKHTDLVLSIKNFKFIIKKFNVYIYKVGTIGSANGRSPVSNVQSE